MTKRNKILAEPPPPPVVSHPEEAVPPFNDQFNDLEKRTFVDFAAVHLYARHFQAPKCFFQAEELWNARSLWLKQKAAR